MYDSGMEHIHPLDKPGVRQVIINALGVTTQIISNWKMRDTVPLEHCFAIERATAGEVTRKDLRPNDWVDIWPELATQKNTKVEA